MKPSTLERVVAETGADARLVQHVVQIALRELHFVAETDAQVTTAAIREACLEFGLPAAYHLGGILTMQDDGMNHQSHRQPSDSLMPEIVQRMLGCSEELPAVRDGWFKLLAERRAAEQGGGSR